MKLIVGLGNPGPKYQFTRHNAGFMFLDILANQAGCAFKGKFAGEFAKGQVGSFDAVLLKPLTYMNRSGDSVVQAAEFFQVSPDQIIVVHDDIDMPFGQLRTRKGGGHGGHNGIRDIMAKLGTGEFNRLKIGVGRPIGEVKMETGRPRPIGVADWVLSDFTKQELEGLQNEVMDSAFAKLSVLLKELS